MEIGQGIKSMVGRERVVQTHFGKLANGAAILRALSERDSPDKADWCSRRLDGFLAHVVNETASDARKLYDAMRINAFAGHKIIPIYKPNIINEKLGISNSIDASFYKTCSMIDHSFRINVYSTVSEICSSLGARKIPKQTDKLSHLRMIVGESNKDGFYCIELSKYAALLEPLLRHCRKAWTQGQLKLDPHGIE